MTPLEKQKKIIKIMDKYFDLLKKIVRGGKIDPSLAKKLKISPEIKGIFERAYNRGRLDAKFNKQLTLREIKREISKMEDIKNPWFSLSKESTEAEITYQLNKMRTRVTRETMEALKPEFKVLEETFKNDIPPEKWMATELRKITKDTRQDWDMVVKSELINKKNQGFAQAILDGESPFSNDGPDTLIFKRPTPNACKHCKRLYLEKDGITPRVFKLSEMISYGNNVGKKVEDWKPVLGILHPSCQCLTQVLPKGATFDSNGNMVVKKKGGEK